MPRIKLHLLQDQLRTVSTQDSCAGALARLRLRRDAVSLIDAFAVSSHAGVGVFPLLLEQSPIHYSCTGFLCSFPSHRKYGHCSPLHHRLLHPCDCCYLIDSPGLGMEGLVFRW
jgi:hypothetical protein